MQATEGLSLAHVAQELGEGGDFQGWQMASAEHVTSLIESLYPTLSFSGNEVIQHHVHTTTSGSANNPYTPYTQPFFDMFGGVLAANEGTGAYRANNDYLSRGLFWRKDTVSYAGVRYSYHYDPYSRNYTSYTTQYADVSMWNEDSAVSGYGVFLINDTAQYDKIAFSEGRVTGGNVPGADVTSPSGLIALLLLPLLSSRLRRRKQSS